MQKERKLNFIRVTTLVIFVAVIAWPVQAQWSWQNQVQIRGDGVAMGGAGMSFIDGESFFVFALRTELTFGQFGVGIDVPLRFNTDNGELRDEDWNSTYDFFRALRYIRYGRKRRSPVYARLGTIEAARLGHGFIVNYYTNEARYDDRKIGSEFDLRFRYWGLESIVSNYDRVEVIGGRAYVQPLRDTPGVGLLNRLKFGATLVSDRDPDATGATDDDVSIGGLDIELPLVSTGPFFSLLYADHARIFNFGSGQAVGIELGLWKLGGLLTLQTKLERRFLGKRFLPSYFGPFYEVERFDNSGVAPVRKTDLLLARTSREQGIYGELFGHVLNVVKLLGTFERIDGFANSGRLHLAGFLSRGLGPISARAIYDKTRIDDFADAFTLDERSILRAGLGYQVNAYLYLFTDYVRTFEVNATTGKLESQRRVEPRLTFVLPLNFTSN